MTPITRYCRREKVHIAYQVVGEGPIDVVFLPQFWSHLEMQWEEPRLAGFLERLASFSRLILFDKRGCGLSDPIPVSGRPLLDDWMDDLRAVMAAAGSDRAALVAHSGGGAVAMLFAAMHPQSTTALVLHHAYPRLVRDESYPQGVSPVLQESIRRTVESSWGTGATIAYKNAATYAGLKEWFGRFERASASPGAALATLEMLSTIDLRDVLSTIRVPTLVLHRTGNRFLHRSMAAYLAHSIPDAHLLELPGDDHDYFLGDTEPMLAAIEEFLTGRKPTKTDNRVLATVLFADVANSTGMAAKLGDHRWKTALDQFEAIADREIRRFRGKLIDTAGDGLLATFDGPARAVECATMIRDRLRTLDLEIRVGVHTGEVEQRGEKVAGLAVHIAARIQGLASPGQVLASRTVRDLVVGSDIHFESLGAHELRGVDGEWELHEVRL